MRENSRTFIGIGLITIALVLVIVVAYRNSSKSDENLVFASNQMLGALWTNYKTEYLEAGTSRTLDKQRGNITTSEGESYTMLRAVWMSDKPTFDASWSWTKDNLQHKNDHLFSWLFGKNSSGKYTILTDQGGQNSASDADGDIALSLVFAYSRWQDPAYLDAARGVINDIWDKEVLMVNGSPYLVANDLEKFSSSTTAIVNPSYLSPASYRIFAQVDNTHPWASLANNSYTILNASMDSKLNASTTAELPPNWIYVNKTTGAMSAINNPSLTTNYGYDAFRTPWRLALDYQWFKTPQAKTTLEKMSLLSNIWNKNKALSAEYTHAGVPATSVQVPAAYGADIGYFMVADPTAAKEIYVTKLAYLFDAAKNNWHDDLGYYDSNWAWFGIGLYSKQLPNLAAGLPSIK